MLAVSRFEFLNKLRRPAPENRGRFSGRRASWHIARQCFFLASEGSRSTRTSLCFSPYLPVASVYFSLDYGQSHQGRRPKAEAAQVLLDIAIKL